MTLHWQNEPPAWSADGGRIAVTTAPQTDFWRKTHDGGIRDSGHFYHQMVRATSLPRSRSAVSTPIQ
jgi:regulation of enolase protein 1 (concanavalin A-like superfamily)